MEQLSLPEFSSPDGRHQPCRGCGEPTRSKYGYCQENSGCRKQYAAAYGADPVNRERVNATRAEHRAVHGRSDTTPCKVCGQPTRSKIGYCNRTRQCHAVAERVRLGPGDPCRLCGGPTSQRSKYGYCYLNERCRRACQRARQDAFLATHPGYEAEARHRRKTRRALAEAKKRAGKTGVPFSLTEADLPPIPDVCPVFGMSFYVPDGTTKGGPVASSLDLDKIVPELGYAPGNVQWISHKANAMKRDATPAELLQFADWIYAMFRPAVTRLDH